MTAQAYCTATTIKARIGITDSTDDTILGTIATQVCGWLEGKIGFPVGPIASVERKFDGSAVRWTQDGCYLAVYPWGCRDITVVKTASATDGSYTTQTLTDVVVRPHDHERNTDWPGFELWVKDTASWSWPTYGFDVIAITATWGWAAIPDDLKSIAERVGVAAFRARGAGSGRTFSMGEDIDGLASEELSGADWGTIDKYQNLRQMVA